MATRNKRVEFNCEYCGGLATDKPSHYNRKKRHFCSMGCYSKFRAELLPIKEQHAYNGVRKGGERN